MFPFKEKIIEENESYILVKRIFTSSLSEIELNWHMDEEDRDIFVISGEGWYIQVENEIPKLMQKQCIYKIPKETWHRIINKNGTNLEINIKKYK